MSSPRVPERSRPGIKALLSLPSEAAGALIEALRTATPTLRPSTLTATLVASLPSEYRATVAQAVDTLIELYIVRDAQGANVEEFAEYLYDAIRYPGDFPELRDADHGQINGLLRTLLGFYDVLGITSKAQYIISDNEHVFCSARALTDVRPIFGEDIERPALNAVILHMLRIHYHDDTHSKAIVIALDSDDVESLRAVLERAATKEATLRKELDGRIRVL